MYQFNIRQLVPMKYFKTKRMYDENHHFDIDISGNPIDKNGNKIINYRIETGLIAQSVQNIEALKHCVIKGKDKINIMTGQPYGLNRFGLDYTMLGMALKMSLLKIFPININYVESEPVIMLQNLYII